MSTRRRVFTPVLAVLALVVTGIGLAAPAQAAARDGVCDAGEFCVYYNSNQAGSLSDFTTSVSDYGDSQPSCYEFKGAGAGQGLCVKNEGASVWNRTSGNASVFFNSGYGGASQSFASGARANLDATLKNENASHRLGGAAPPTGCSSDGTDTRLPTTILVYRTGLGRVDRVDFKTYVKNVLPKEWIPSWPRESLDSGAIAVKTYAWYWAINSTRRTPGGACYDVRDDTGDQVYVPGSAVASTSAAVDRTWARRMSRDNRIFVAHYCATSTACGDWVAGEWLSQNGSRDLANQGRTATQILTTYYRNIRVTG